MPVPGSCTGGLFAYRASAFPSSISSSVLQPAFHFVLARMLQAVPCVFAWETACNASLQSPIWELRQDSSWSSVPDETVFSPTGGTPRRPHILSCHVRCLRLEAQRKTSQAALFAAWEVSFLCGARSEWFSAAPHDAALRGGGCGFPAGGPCCGLQSAILTQGVFCPCPVQFAYARFLNTSQRIRYTTQASRSPRERDKVNTTMSTPAGSFPEISPAE